VTDTNNKITKFTEKLLNNESNVDSVVWPIEFREVNIHFHFISALYHKKVDARLANTLSSIFLNSNDISDKYRLCFHAYETRWGKLKSQCI